MPLFDTLHFIIRHPLNQTSRVGAITRFVRWQLVSRLVPGDVVVPWVNEAQLIVRKGETGLTGNIYCGLHEFSDMAFVLHVLRKDDLFVDVGANVGSYTILACASIGARGVCFEPVPTTFARLQRNIAINDLGGRVQCLNVGVGERTATLRFTAGQGCMNHVIAEHESDSDAIEVPVVTLDEAIGDECPFLMKIDVEGFETPALAGATHLLAHADLHAVIMELNGAGERYGFDEGAILKQMRELGFETCRYEPSERRLVDLDGKNLASGNTLFVRNRAAVLTRLESAPRFSVLDQSL